jgi:hypothetical protein
MFPRQGTPDPTWAVRTRRPFFAGRRPIVADPPAGPLRANTRCTTCRGRPAAAEPLLETRECARPTCLTRPTRPSSRSLAFCVASRFNSPNRGERALPQGARAFTSVRQARHRDRAGARAVHAVAGRRTHRKRTGVRGCLCRRAARMGARKGHRHRSRRRAERRPNRTCTTSSPTRRRERRLSRVTRQRVSRPSGCTSGCTIQRTPLYLGVDLTLRFSEPKAGEAAYDAYISARCSGSRRRCGWRRPGGHAGKRSETPNGVVDSCR